MDSLCTQFLLWTVCDTFNNANDLTGKLVCDVLVKGNVFLVLTVWDVHTNGNVFLGLTVWNVHNKRKCLSFPHDPKIVGDRPSWDPGRGRVRSGEASKPNHFRRYVHSTR